MDDVTRGVFERLARLEDQLLRMRATPAIPAYAQLSDAGDFGREGRVIYAEAEGALYVDTGSAWEEASGGGTGVTDHGALTGLSDDDHAQYHTDARGDARYWQLSTDLATQAELDAHKTSSDHDGRYYTEAEVDASLAAKANTSHTHTATDVTDFDTQVRTSKIHQLAVPTAATPMNGYGFTGLGDLAWPTITLSNSASGVLNIASSGATSKLDLGSKTAISFYDTWLRLNNDRDFAGGIYCGTGIFRTDGQLQVGAAGATFLVNGATITHQSNTVWTSGNDGAGSGLDADLLDGQHGSYYQQAIAAGGLGIDKLDIDGGTDIGAALADADLIIVDDGAGGTNRKSALSRVYTYIASKLTGAISSVLTSNLTASRAVVSDGSGKLSASAVTSTEIGYLSGVTSGLQAQLGAKAPTSASPIGGVHAFAGSAAPTGWLLCYGQAVSRATYAALFAVIGTTYGAGDGSTTFNVPDLRGRAIAGLDNMGGSDAGRLDWANTLGTSGGSQTHTLATSEIPSHTHTTTVGHGEAGTHDWDLDFASPGGRSFKINDNRTTDAAGGGGSHNNMQPTTLMNWIIYAAA